MNTGIGDAINLAWKLAAVVKQRASATLLDTYEAERISFARRLVATTDRVFTFASAEGRLADIVRTRLAPLVLAEVTKLEVAREFLFRTVSQILINYRGQALSEGVAGHVHGGDRLPWAPVAGQDNYAPLARPRWQAHVYGQAAEAVSAWCTAHDVPLHVFAWQPAHEAAGLRRDALYVVRPDAYVALAEPTPSPAGLERYFAERGLTP
jgi:hypothetical protein